MSPLGVESVSFFTRAILESNPEMDLWAKDGDNGFGRLSRISGLYQTKEHFPEILLGYMYNGFSARCREVALETAFYKKK